MLGLHNDQSGNNGSKKDPRQISHFTGGETESQSSKSSVVTAPANLKGICQGPDAQVTFLHSVPCRLDHGDFFVLVFYYFLLGHLPPGLVNECSLYDSELEKDFFPKPKSSQDTCLF